MPDHVGCGRSDKPGDDRYAYTLESRVDDLERLLDHLDLDRKITLVVHDWGGMIGLACAVRHPERIARLVVLNTGAFPLPRSKPFPWPLRICRDSSSAPGWSGARTPSAAIAARVGCKRNPMRRDVRDAYVAPYDSWDHRIAILRFVQDIPLGPRDRAWEPGRRPRPTAWICSGRCRCDRLGFGMKDFVFDRHFLDEWTRRFPAAEVHRFADAGHYVLEDAADELIPLIRSFLERHRPASAEAG